MPAKLNLIGEVYGRLTVIDQLPSVKGKFSRTKWLCICECGTTTQAFTGNLRNGDKVSCGCAISLRPQNTAKDMVGTTHGRLTVVARSGSKNRRATWECTCKCGNTAFVSGKDLRSGHVQSCGCLAQESRLLCNVTHGKTGTRTYRIWAGMIQRCTNKNIPKNWPNYGGRGIEVCPEWLSFGNFLLDMGEAPEGLTLERIDNNRGYIKDNCKWASRVEQANNTRRQKYLINGKRYSIRSLAAEMSITARSLSKKIREGKDVYELYEEALNLKRNEE